MKTTTRTGHTRRGFTVLEVLVAVTVFAIVSVVVFSVFRSAIRSQEIGDRETKMLERARFAMDTFERDISNIFFRDETSYNVFMSRMIEEMELDRLRAEADNNWDAFYAKWGDPNEDDDEVKPAIGDPYEKGRMIDLQMFAKDAGETDEISFAIVDPLQLGKPYRPWGLSRVNYTVDKGWLLRRSETVETERRSVLGENLGKQGIPQVTRLAEAVEEFDLSFAFWYDSTWYETGAWNSSQRQIRNPRFVLGNYDKEWLGRFDENNPRPQTDPNNPNAIQPGDEGWNEYINDLDSEPLDRLPSYIRLRLVLADPNNKARKQTFERIIHVPPADESYAAGEILSEEGRENERSLRDDRYLRIYPGVARKGL
jgi:prepilin-type N-terminal cleavage/methylation domain-containing protein